MRSVVAVGTAVPLSSAPFAGLTAADTGRTAFVDRRSDSGRTAIAAADTGRTAVVDRLDGDYAVWSIEEAGETPDRRVTDPWDLQKAGRYEGAVHRVVVGAPVRDEAESERRQRTSSWWLRGLAAGLSPVP